MHESMSVQSLPSQSTHNRSFQRQVFPALILLIQTTRNTQWTHKNWTNSMANKLLTLVKKKHEIQPKPKPTGHILVHIIGYIHSTIQHRTVRITAHMFSVGEYVCYCTTFSDVGWSVKILNYWWSTVGGNTFFMVASSTVFICWMMIVLIFFCKNRGQLMSSNGPSYV